MKFFPLIYMYHETQLCETSKIVSYNIVFAQEQNRSLVPGMQFHILDNKLTNINGKVDNEIDDMVDTSIADTATTSVDISPPGAP